MLTTLNSPLDGAQIRAVTLDNGRIGFVGKDVAAALGYSNPSDALTKHCKGVAFRYPLPTPGGTQEVRVLLEPDVLRLIIGSRLPAAERFEAWVFEEVLPTLIRTGTYTTAPAPALPSPPTPTPAPSRFVIETGPALGALGVLRPFREIPKDCLILRLDRDGPDLVSRQVVDLAPGIANLVEQSLLKVNTEEEHSLELTQRAYRVVAHFASLASLPRALAGSRYIAALIPECSPRLTSILVPILDSIGFIPLTLTIDDQGPLFSEL